MTSPRVASDDPSLASDEAIAQYSDLERLATRDLATLTDRQIDEARRMIRQFAAVFANLRSRRYRQARRGRAPDFRALLRQFATRGNELTELRYRSRPIRRTRLLLLCDVSGSMERYATFLLELIYGMRQEMPTAEVAVFATRLSVISNLLDTPNLQRSLRDVMASAADWGGGTDIGGCLRDFNQRYASSLLRSYSVVVLLSDGWDRGDPDVMRREMHSLRRHAARIIWLNPLLRFTGYEPLTRGMRTAMPHLDHFLPCHSVQSLARFARVLRREWR